MPIFPSNRRGLGCKIEGLKNSTTFSLSKLSLSEVPRDVKAFSLEQFIPLDGKNRPIILHQGATSSCVAHAFVAAIHIAEKRAGLAYLPASRLFAYYGARREHSSLITDSGTYLRTCAAALRSFGIPDESVWPFSTNTFTVNRRPSYAAYRQAQPRAGGEYVKIFSFGESRLEAVKSALYAGHAVTFGTLVSERFVNEDKEINVTRDSSPIAGAHAMCIIGWKTVDNVEWYRVLNSWGPSWRDGGLCWMHEDMIASTAADDFHVIHGWNRIAKKGP